MWSGILLSQCARIPVFSEILCHFPFSPACFCLFTRVVRFNEHYFFFCLNLSEKFSKPCALWQMHLAGGCSVCAVCSLWSCCLCKLLRCRPKPSGIPLRGKVSIDCLMLANPSRAQPLASSEKGVREEQHEHVCTVCAEIYEPVLPQGKEATAPSLPLTPPLPGYTTVFLVAWHHSRFASCLHGRREP